MTPITGKMKQVTDTNAISESQTAEDGWDTLPPVQSLVFMAPIKGGFLTKPFLRKALPCTEGPREKGRGNQIRKGQ